MTLARQASGYRSGKAAPKTDSANPFRRQATGIREQGYRHWDGEYTGHAFRWWTITRAALRSSVYTKGRLFMVLLLIGAAWIFPFFFGVFYFFGEIPGRLRPPDEMLRENLNNMLGFWQWMWAVVFSATIGSRFVANDLRSEALYIYLSKPLRRVDYFVGKVLACFLWMFPVTLLPALWVFLAANGSSNKLLKLTEPGEIFFELLGVHLLLITMCSVCAVAISSFTKRWALALIGWISAAFVVQPIADITSSATRNPEWQYISPIHDIRIVSEHLFEQPFNPQFDPAWQGALWVVIGLIAVALGVFFARVWFLEVAE